MRLSPLLPVLCFGLTAPLFAQVPKDQVPQMQNVEPKNGKIGSVLKATGLHLGKTKVEEVYLTDHTFDMMVKVLDQTDNSIQFRIPPSVKPGKLQLLVKTAGKEPVLLEEPVYITVDEEKDKDTSTEVASAAPSAGAAR
jgi:hypothetical protein